MKFTLLTIFPEMFPGSLGESLAGKALDSGLWSYDAVNLRDYADDKHKSVDDTPAGGGAGMVMRADVLGKAIDDKVGKKAKLIYMSPRGLPLTQSKVEQLGQEQELAILCGRFEGVDERVLQEYDIEEISIGDYILSGGEVAAIVLMDTIIRQIDGVIGNKNTLNEESFGKNADYAGLLEYPLYTRPLNWKNREIPEVLLSGHHERVNKWRLERSKEITQERRADLWKKYEKIEGRKDG